MFLGSYHFDGDPAELLAAYERLWASYPPDAVQLHACVVRGTGITIYDACPSRRVFEDFSTSKEFAGALAAAGLPRPVVTACGEVHRASTAEVVPA